MGRPILDLAKKPRRAGTALRAIVHKTGQIVWDRPIGENSGAAGVPPTAMGLTISGDNLGNLLIRRTSDAATLWYEELGCSQGAPVTYELDGTQTW